MSVTSVAVLTYWTIPTLYCCLTTVSFRPTQLCCQGSYWHKLVGLSTSISYQQQQLGKTQQKYQIKSLGITIDWLLKIILCLSFSKKFKVVNLWALRYCFDWLSKTIVTEKLLSTYVTIMFLKGSQPRIKSHPTWIEKLEVRLAKTCWTLI